MGILKLALNILYALVTLGLPHLLDYLKKRDARKQAQEEQNRAAKPGKTLAEGLVKRDPHKVQEAMQQQKQNEEALRAKIKKATNRRNK